MISVLTKSQYYLCKRRSQRCEARPYINGGYVHLVQVEHLCAAQLVRYA